MYHITSRSEYEYCIKRGYQPLIQWRWFSIDIKLRIQLQYELFGTDFEKANERYYRYVWKYSIHRCHETGKPLYNYSSVFISHIISRGSDRRMAIDPRNVNILSFDAHNNWETGNRKHMNIWTLNRIIINMLKADYQNG